MRKQTRKDHEYKIGDKILLTDSRKRSKLAPPREGPYQVKRVFTNGTLLIQRGAILERVNIRRVSPYFESEDHSLNPTVLYGGFTPYLRTRGEACSHAVSHSFRSAVSLIELLRIYL
jgi:hypothetical protein